MRCSNRKLKDWMIFTKENCLICFDGEAISYQYTLCDELKDCNRCIFFIQNFKLLNKNKQTEGNYKMILDAEKLIESINTKEDADKFIKELCEQFKNNKNYECKSEYCDECILKDFDNMMKFVVAIEMHQKL